LPQANYSWLTPQRLRRTTICLFATGLLASAVLISGSGKQPTSAQASGATPATHIASR
jgi:hypothetical protein